MARGKKAEKILTPEEKLVQVLVPVEEQPYPVPGNWCWTKIGVLSDLYRGVSYKKEAAHSEKQNDDILIMRGGNIGEGYIDVDSDNVYVHRDLVQENQVVRKHDIIIVASTGSTKVIGRAGVSNEDYTDVAFGSFLMLVRPNAKANPKYVDYYFQSDIYRERIRSLASGVNINNIRADYITESKIPFPPILEQQRIVDRIKSLFAKLDEAKEKAQTVVDGFETRKAAILHKAFTGELTAQWRKTNNRLADNWEYRKIGKFAEVKGGKRLPKGAQLTREKTTHPYLRIADFGTNTIDTSDLHYITDEIYEQISNYVISKDDVYISIVGSIGKVGTIPEHLDGANLTENAAKIISKRTLPCYLAAVLSSPTIQEDIQKRIRSATLGKLSLLNIKEIIVPLPDKQEQAEIVHILDILLVKEQQAKEAAEAVLDRIDTMKKALLARAFRGELGTNDPAEESAVELLIDVL